MNVDLSRRQIIYTINVLEKLYFSNKNTCISETISVLKQNLSFESSKDEDIIFSLTNKELMESIKYIEEEFEFFSGKLEKNEQYQNLLKERSERIKKNNY